MKSTRNIEESIKRLAVESGGPIHDRILDRLLKRLKRPNEQAAADRANMRRFVLWRRACCLAAALVVIASWVCFVMSGKVTNLKKELAQARQDVAPAQPDDSATINFYLEEHRDMIARHAAFSSAPPQPAQMRVSRQDILYYESFDDEPDYMNPGIIVRGPSSERKIDSSDAPVISNGHTLTLTEARKNAGFVLQAPPRLYPAYRLEKIRRIEDRDALHLSYTDGINTISLFEQHLDSEHQLEPQDFREYAVYRNKGQGGGTILAWRDDELSYVLIGNTELSQLMDMAQSISAGK